MNLLSLIIHRKYWAKLILVLRVSLFQLYGHIHPVSIMLCNIFSDLSWYLLTAGPRNIYTHHTVIKKPNILWKPNWVVCQYFIHCHENICKHIATLQKILKIDEVSGNFDAIYESEVHTDIKNGFETQIRLVVDLNLTYSIGFELTTKNGSFCLVTTAIKFEGNLSRKILWRGIIFSGILSSRCMSIAYEHSISH